MYQRRVCKQLKALTVMNEPLQPRGLRRYSNHSNHGNFLGVGVGSNRGRPIEFFYVLNRYRAFHIGIH